MPARKKVKAVAVKTIKQPVSSTKLLQKKETRIGLAILGVLVLGMGVLTAQALTKVAGSLRPRSTQPYDATATSITALPTPVTTAMASPSASPSATADSQKLQAVKKLSYTSAAVAVRVKEGDSFWRIAARTCGNGKLAEKLQRQQGYTHRAIQPGTVLYIQCR